MKKDAGFTIVEALLVMGIFAVLASAVVINMAKPQISAAVQSSSSVLISDIKLQQLKAMSGDTAGEFDSQPHGIYFEAGKYTLFAGSAYVPGRQGNFTVDLGGGAFFSSVDLPGSQIVFQKRNGEVLNYNEGFNSITIEHPAGTPRMISINRYGAITIN